MKRLSVLEKIGESKFELDEGHPHIEVHEEQLRALCPDLSCLYVCPANVYSEQNGRIVADWAGCVECGTCRVACPPEGLTWVFPRGGFGIVYREG